MRAVLQSTPVPSDGDHVSSRGRKDKRLHWVRAGDLDSRLMCSAPSVNPLRDLLLTLSLSPKWVKPFYIYSLIDKDRTEKQKMIQVLR